MAGYKFEDELRGKAQQFCAVLAANGIEAAVRPDSFRDYTLKLSARKNGKGYGSINLYYSPKRSEFTCKVHQITDEAIGTDIETAWATIAQVTTQAEKAPPIIAKGVQAYVDGSYHNGRVGYGAVLLRDGQEVQRFSGSVTEDLESRQVAGELMATITVLEYCQKNNIPTIEILYDYAGIEKWARGQWKANLPLTQRYAAFVRACAVKIKWHKVKSHSGTTWNDVADELAKKGAGA